MDRHQPEGGNPAHSPAQNRTARSKFAPNPLPPALALPR